MNKTLMSSWEVKQASPVMQEYPDNIICVFIGKDERNLFYDCALGYNLYDSMIASLIDVSSVLPYEEGVYNEGDKVLYEDAVLISLSDGNAIEPCDLLARQYWKIASKFDNECYQDLYDKYLKYYIAFTIVGRSGEFASYKASSNGLVKYSEDFRGQGSGLITINKTEMYSWKNSILLEASRAISGVLDYIKDKHTKFLANETDGCDFSIVSNIEDLCSDCDPRQSFERKRSRINFIK